MDPAHRALLTDHQYYTITAGTIAVAAISTLGCSFIIFSYAKFPQLRNFAFEQVVNMAFADFGIGVTSFLGSPDDGSISCTLQGLLQQFFELASVLWTTVIAGTLFMAIIRQTDVEQYRGRIYCYGWVVPGVLALLPLSTGSYGDAGAWCWVNSKTRAETTAWRFTIFYVPLWFAIAFNGYVYWLTTKTLRRLLDVSSSVEGDDAPQRLEALIDRLKYYPLILIICWTLATINRIHNSIHERQLYALVLSSRLLTTLGGLLNSVAYGINGQVRTAWGPVLKACTKGELLRESEMTSTSSSSKRSSTEGYV